MIKTVDTSTLRNHLADTVAEVSTRRDFFLVTKKSKPMAALVNLDLFEDLLAMTSKEYLKSVREARADYKGGRTFTHQDVFGRIG